MNVALYILVAGLVLLFSHLFDEISQKLKVPSVLLLLLSGIIIRQTGDYIGFVLPFVNKVLPIIGTVALVLIVLEGSLELRIAKEKKKLVFSTFFAALIGVIGCSILLAFYLQYYATVSFHKAIVNVIPFCVISSAVAISSAKQLPKKDREFVVYESSLSDIIGVLWFNFFIIYAVPSWSNVLNYGIIFILSIIAAILFSGILIFYLNRIKQKVKFLPIFGFLLILYGLGKWMHLSPLLLIMIFGLVLGNFERLLFSKITPYFNVENLNNSIKHFELISSESVFFMRTIFFILFGYSIELNTLFLRENLLIGSVIFGVIIFTRLIFIYFLSKENWKTILFYGPRGLITVLLFLSIPENQRILEINEGSVMFVVVFSILFLLFDTKKSSNNT
mgnify:CR=1 FL=1